MSMLQKLWSHVEILPKEEGNGKRQGAKSCARPNLVNLYWVNPYWDYIFRIYNWFINAEYIVTVLFTIFTI